MLSSTTFRPLVLARASPSNHTIVASPTAGRRASSAVVRAVRNYDPTPGRELSSASRSTNDECLRQEKILVQRTKDEITDYCTTLEGDECRSCWDAYSELNKLEQKLPIWEIERMVKGSEGDVRCLIDNIHHHSNLGKKMAEKARDSVSSSSQGQPAKPRPFPVPDGLPKTQEELDEEGEALMAESASTRLLRRMSRDPDCYTPRPDHETE